MICDFSEVERRDRTHLPTDAAGARDERLPLDRRRQVRDRGDGQRREREEPHAGGNQAQPQIQGAFQRGEWHHES